MAHGSVTRALVWTALTSWMSLPRQSTKPIAPRVTGFVTAFVAALMVLVGSPYGRQVQAASSVPSGFQEYHVLGDEQHVWDMFDRVVTGESASGELEDALQSVVSIVASTDNQIVYYDHWEDGFDPELDVALAGGDPDETSLQSSTLIFGNGSTANEFGDACDFIAAACAGGTCQ